MSIQKINIGNIANDGTGDTHRAAFKKINENFDELSNSIQGEVDAIADTIVQRDSQSGINVFKINFRNEYSSVSTFPDATSQGGMVAYSINENAEYYSNGNSWIKLLDEQNGNSQITANLTVSGDITANNITVYSNISANNATLNNITTGNIVANDVITADRFVSLHNGDGINFQVGDDAWIGDTNLADTVIIKGQQNSANGYLIFGDASQQDQLGRSSFGPLTYSGSFEVAGNVSAANVFTIGNVNASTVEAVHIIGQLDTAQQTNITSIGNLSTLNVDGLTQVGNLTTAGNITAGFYIGNGALLSGILTSASEIVLGNSNLKIDGLDGNILASVNNSANVLEINTSGVTVVGNVTANYFVGDGSLLTGITVGEANAIVNGTSNISIPTTDSNIVVGVNATPNVAVFHVNGVNVTGTISGDYLSGDGSQVYGVVTQLLANGNSNVSIPMPNGDISLSVNSIANIVSIQSTDVFVNSNLSVTGVSNLGNISNVTISGGNIGEVLFTNGNSSLYWSAVPAQQFAVSFSSANSLTTNLALPYPTMFVSVDSRSLVWKKFSIAVDSAPTGSNAVVDIQYSTDDGSTWASIFPTGDVNKIVLTDGSLSSNVTVFETPNLYADGTRFKPVVLQVGSTNAGANMTIIGLGEVI